ncbi:hypothetical protein QA597_11190 [Marinilabiliaceae bacterium ANBcel2]|nr:hypothetical protein [Marinilabiliaceae bacterium ANBcel2]
MKGNIGNIEEGLRLTLEKRVKEGDLASSKETSDVKALSTSALISFVEKAVNTLINPYLETDITTVSSEINIKHFKPVFINELIRCLVHLKYIDKNELFFDVSILDKNHDPVAIGAHHRYIVNINKFESSLISKLNRSKD